MGNNFCCQSKLDKIDFSQIKDLTDLKDVVKDQINRIRKIIDVYSCDLDISVLKEIDLWNENLGNDSIKEFYYYINLLTVLNKMTILIESGFDPSFPEEINNHDNNQKSRNTKQIINNSLDTNKLNIYLNEILSTENSYEYYKLKAVEARLFKDW